MSEKNGKASAPSTNSAQPSAKRLIFVTGDKGGVGKSAFARFLLDEYRHYNLTCRAIDSDTSNSDLFRFYQGMKPAVERIDFTIPGEADHVIDTLEKQSGIILVDLPARSRHPFRTFIEDMSMLDRAKEAGYEITVCSVMSKSKNSINALKELLVLCKDQVHHIVVKNLFFGESNKFNRYNDSQARVALKASGGKEIEMPELFYTSWDAIEDQDLPFRKAASATESPLLPSQRTRTARWLLNMEQSIQPVKEWLGLECVQAAAPVPENVEAN